MHPVSARFHTLRPSIPLPSIFSPARVSRPRSRLCLLQYQRMTRCHEDGNRTHLVKGTTSGACVRPFWHLHDGPGYEWRIGDLSKASAVLGGPPKGASYFDVVSGSWKVKGERDGEESAQEDALAAQAFQRAKIDHRAEEVEDMAGAADLEAAAEPATEAEAGADTVVEVATGKAAPVTTTWIAGPHSPRPDSLRDLILRAFAAGHRDRDSIVEMVIQHCNKQRQDIVDALGNKEKIKQFKLWTRQGTQYELTAVGQALMPVQQNKQKRSRRCGMCEACSSANCGACIACLDMPQFGGQGVRNQVCIQRQCQNKVRPDTQGTAATAAAKRPVDLPAGGTREVAKRRAQGAQRRSAGNSTEPQPDEQEATVSDQQVTACLGRSNAMPCDRT